MTAVSGMQVATPAPFAPDASHRSALESFQGGEEAFVWGLDSTSGAPWFLPDGEAKEARAHVKSHVVCPVPGCSAALTTVSRTARRDGLRHLTGAGGHSRESIDHANGCAAVFDWLSAKYPNSRVRREEYTSPTGERRADVLITGRRGDRIAFEVQYSAITPEHWLERSNSYADQGIVDVWLWGHRGANLNLQSDGRVALTPAQAALVAAGKPLLFLNPEQQMIAMGTEERELRAMNRHKSGGVVRTWVRRQPASTLEIEPLDGFGAHVHMGMSSARLYELGAAFEKARRHDARVVREREQLWVRRRADRSPRLARIRGLLGEVSVWNGSEAQQAIREYLGVHADSRIETYKIEPVGPRWLRHWQCAIYFDLVAGCERPFTVRDAKAVARYRRATVEHSQEFKAIAHYLNALVDQGLLTRELGSDGYPVFTPTYKGAWW